ncbi:class I adenylate-forming enzyme family protein [[Pseudopropionibacterium] massiliense]|jgi:putative AMP-binding protein|uniref:class I adenylate-forming enzyme family protein n=1 Tax=[Pseudopropionibacterium] massiliense TaxID=2220000 RepID=UPI00102FA8BC|nr:AMP-binding protein [[Pseudopropionibacterium] massiliense]
MSVVLDLIANVTHRPGGVAVIDGEVTLTWSELFSLVRQVGAWLAAEGFARGDRLVYAGAPDHRMVVWFWAALRQGVVFVPLHDELTAEQISYTVTNCRARAVVTDPRAGTLELTSGPRVLTSDAAWLSALACNPDQWSAPRLPTPDELALLIYTSGTTGNPRGVVCPHRQVSTATRSINSQLRYHPDDVILCRLPLAFDYGLYQLLLAARVGCTIVLAQRTSDFNLIDVLTHNRVTVVPLVPTLAQMLVLLQLHRPENTHVRLFTNTGARMNQRTMEQLLTLFPGASYASMYGMTECKRISILPPQEYAAHPRSVGRAIPGLRITIEDSKGNALPPGFEGEIVVRGDTVMSGYWGIPLTDNGRFRPDGSQVALHTGDQGYLDEDGLLYFSGRSDDIIKRHGMRISLHEIEDAADRCPGVQAAVALRPETETDPLILAYVGDTEEGKVLQYLWSHLDQARRPSSVRLLPTFPANRNGKPDRKAIAELIRNNSTNTKETAHATA